MVRIFKKRARCTCRRICLENSFLVRVLDLCRAYGRYIEEEWRVVDTVSGSGGDGSFRRTFILFHSHNDGFTVMNIGVSFDSRLFHCYLRCRTICYSSTESNIHSFRN